MVDFGSDCWFNAVSDLFSLHICACLLVAGATWLASLRLAAVADVTDLLSGAGPQRGMSDVINNSLRGVLRASSFLTSRYDEAVAEISAAA